MPDEEPGLLGNLPRSRPGTRSEKRESTGGSPGKTEATGAPPGKTKTAASKPAPRRSQATKRAGGAKKAKGAGSVKSKAPAKGAPSGRNGAPTSRPVPVNVVEPTEGERPTSDASSRGPLRSAAKVAGTGLRVAEGVTREVLRRLPRP